MGDIPEIHYAKTPDGLHVAYQAFGTGTIDVVVLPDWISQIEANWSHPRSRAVIERIAGFARVIVFDKRGVGLSDPVSVAETASLEGWLEDLQAVLDDVGVARATLLGQGQGGQLGVLAAVAAPERTRSLVLFNAYAYLGRDDDYPWGFPAAAFLPLLERTENEWGTGFFAEVLAPSAADDPTAREWFARVQRNAASPRTARALQEAFLHIDVRQLVPLVSVPTLVVHVAGDQYVRIAQGRWLADHIKGSRFVEIPGSDHWFFMGPHLDRGLETIEEFVTGTVHARDEDRVLATVLFTDVVGSTTLAAEFGDARWRETLDRIDDVVADQLQRHRGHLVKHTGDGHLATFDGPGRAIRCARAIGQAVRPLGIELRTGLHTGEVEMRGPSEQQDVSGIAVHIAARVMAEAGPGEVMVSGAIPPLVAGSGLEFAARGSRELKGVPGTWQLFQVLA